MKQYFECFEKEGFIKKGQVNDKKILQTPTNKIRPILQEHIELTTLTYKEITKDSGLSHFSSLSLGGSRFPCDGFECRMDKVQQLSHIVALYSDKVYIKNFLDDLLEHANARLETKLFNEDEFRLKFCEDLSLLLYLRPLIEKGLIVPYASKEHLCPQCLVNDNYGKDADKRYAKEYQWLENEFLNKIVVYLQKNESGDFEFLISGPEDLIVHGQITVSLACLPKSIKDSASILNKLEKFKKVKLTNNVIKKAEIISTLTSREFSNVIPEFLSRKELGTSFITDSPLHIKILDSISNDKDIIMSNQLVEQYMTSLVPFIEGLSVDKILELRSRENESFLMFRLAMQEAIKEYNKNLGRLTVKDAKAIHSDIIKPKLAVLDKRVKVASRDLLKSSYRTATAWIGAISFGYMSGMLTGDMIKMASCFGGMNIISNLLQNTMKESDSERKIVEDSMYFLWKLRKIK